MHQLRKRIPFLALLTTLLITIFASNLMATTSAATATTSQSIHIEWDYESYSVPDGLELSGYRLYKEGVKVCQFDFPYDYAGDCEFQSDNGLFNFTLTALFDDGSESPDSAPFPFLLGTNRTGQLAAMNAILGLLLK